MKSSATTRSFDSYCRTGDPVALAAVFDAVAPDLMRVATRLAPDRTSAEDLVQETFLSAMEARASWDGERPVGSWMLGILTNRARRAYRDRDRDRSIQVLDERRMAESGSSTHAAPSERLTGAELDLAVRSALTTLPKGEREAVAARLFDDLSPAELAAQLGVRPGAVRVRLHRGLARLRAALPASFALGSGWLALRGRVLVGARNTSQGAGAAGAGAATAKATASLGQPVRLTAAAALLAGVGLGGWILLRDATPMRPSAEAVGPPIERQIAAVSDESLEIRPAELRTVRTLAESELVAAQSPGKSATKGHGPEAEPGGFLEGRVLDQDGQPLPGAEVRGWNSRRIEGEPIAVAFSDSSGSYRIGPLGEGFTVGAELSGWLLRSGFRGTLAPGKVAAGLDITMGDSATLEGVVTDWEGRPLAGVRVFSHPFYGSISSRLITRHEGILKLEGHGTEAVTDASGLFSIVARASNPSRIHVAHTGFLSYYADLHPRGNPHEVRLVRDAILAREAPGVRG